MTGRQQGTQIAACDCSERGAGATVDPLNSARREFEDHTVAICAAL